MCLRRLLRAILVKYSFGQEFVPRCVESKYPSSDQIWPTKKQFVSSGSSLANQLEELFAKSHILMLDKNSLLPLASELLSNFSEKGLSQPHSEIRSTVFSLSSPLAEMYKDRKSQKSQQNHIPKDQNVLESGETLESPRKLINTETPKSCSPEIVITESVGSPKISMAYSRNCSFRGDKKSTDCHVEDCGKDTMAGGGNYGSSDQVMTLLGITLTGKPKWVQLLICGGGFFFGYLVNGVCEEFVYNRLQFSYGWYFTFVQAFVYLGLIYLNGFRPKHIINPWKTYVKLSGVLMASQGLTKGSLEFLNYPAQIMFKSTKVLPVMVMGAFIPGLRRKYSLEEYISAIMLVVGLIIFTLADAETSPNFHVLGVIMVSGTLIFDAFLGNLQEAIFTTNPSTTQMEMLFCSTLMGLPFLILPMVLTGEVFKAWKACSQHLFVYLVLIFEAMATFVGQLSVLCLIAIFGAATTAMVTTARKALTLLLSYIIFTKPLTEKHATGLLLIGMGIVLKMLPNPMVKTNQKQGSRRETESGEEDKPLVSRQPT